VPERGFSLTDTKRKDRCDVLAKYYRDVEMKTKKYGLQMVSTGLVN
jgi:hypothetical protein